MFLISISLIRPWRMTCTLDIHLVEPAQYVVLILGHREYCLDIPFTPAGRCKEG